MRMQKLGGKNDLMKIESIGARSITAVDHPQSAVKTEDCGV